jgi:flagellar hook-associated protein 1
MSLSHSLASALTGLNASSKAAEIVAANISNASTPGYARRDVIVTAQTVGSRSGGVEIVGIDRFVNSVAIADRRIATAAAGAGSTTAQFFKSVETKLGLPTQPGSLSSRLDALEAALISASASPQSTAQLDRVLSSAQDLVSHARSVSDHIQTERMLADQAIAKDVQHLNDTLTRIAEINSLVLKAQGQSDTAALQDQRAALIEEIAAIVPIREIQKPGGTVALYTAGGAVLLDRMPARLGFEAAGVIVAGMTIANGSLSGLTLNGRPVLATGEGATLGGGRLGANMTLRDQDAPTAQAMLDATFRNIMERLEGIDPSLLPGNAGLITDNGQPFDPLTEVGLSARLAINSAVDPSQGGELWRLRSGIGASIPGPVGDASFLNAMAAALQDVAPTAPGPLPPGNRSAAQHLSGLVSALSTHRLSHESRAGFATAQEHALRQIEAEGGVNLDREMQTLLLIERAYGANAKVIETVDRMLDALMRIGR